MIVLDRGFGPFGGRRGPTDVKTAATRMGVLRCGSGGRTQKTAGWRRLPLVTSLTLGELHVTSFSLANVPQTPDGGVTGALTCVGDADVPENSERNL